MVLLDCQKIPLKFDINDGGGVTGVQSARHVTHTLLFRLTVTGKAIGDETATPFRETATSRIFCSVLDSAAEAHMARDEMTTVRKRLSVRIAPFHILNRAFPIEYLLSKKGRANFKSAFFSCSFWDDFFITLRNKLKVSGSTVSQTTGQIDRARVTLC